MKPGGFHMSQGGGPKGGNPAQITQHLLEQPPNF